MGLQYHQGEKCSISDLHRLHSEIQIEGHCDSRGSIEYNLALGERRAKAVKNYLVSLGIDPRGLTIISYGEEKPAVMGSTEYAFAQNRRGVVVYR